MKSRHNEHLFFDDLEKGCFQIDNNGKIWRIAKKFGNPSVKNRIIKISKREMKYIGNHGYIIIGLRKNEKTHTFLAHRIVWIYYNGKILSDREINHINGIKTDNHPENLESVTAKENTRHAIKNGLKCNVGEKSSNAKLTNNDVKQIRLRYSTGESQLSIAKDFNIHQVNVSLIINRKRWKHI